MGFDFDTPLQLRGTHCSKFDNIERVYGSADPDIIPMWVADMDFRAAEPIREALRAEVERGYFGYFADDRATSAAVAGWLKRRHGWEIDPRWVRYTHGVVSGYGDTIAAFSDPGDGVILFSPVYHAFFRQIEAMGRVAVESLLRLENGRYEMDLDGLAAQLTGRERILTLCSPHNPGGRLWSAEELRAVADFCAKHGLILITDEIHMDLTHPGATSLPLLTTAPDCAPFTVWLSAASKSFNIAGAETGLLIAPDAGLRKKIDAVILDRESSPNRFAMAMIKAAFDHCDDWMDAVRDYVAGNFRILRDRLDAMPGVSVMDMQATYLAWADFSGLGMDDAELLRRFVNDARVAPSPGPQFGSGGAGYMRLNVAMPRASLVTALDRIEAAFADVQ